jgi:hypothetical protein
MASVGLVGAWPRAGWVRAIARSSSSEGLRLRACFRARSSRLSLVCRRTWAGGSRGFRLTIAPPSARAARTPAAAFSPFRDLRASSAAWS